MSKNFVLNIFISLKYNVLKIDMSENISAVNANIIHLLFNLGENIVDLFFAHLIVYPTLALCPDWSILQLQNLKIQSR
jgi:hypothetical protein